MDIVLKQAIERKDLKTFIYLPVEIHKSHKNWAPPIYSDEWAFINPKKNKNLTTSDTVFVLAFANGKPVGRIMGIISHHHNEKYGLKNARFFYPECYNDPDVFHALLEYIENWARERGMTKIIGPFGFSDKDPQGLMIEGFENEPVIATTYNFEYMVKFVEQEGYIKEADCVSYKLLIPEKNSELHNRILHRTLRSNDLNILKITNKWSLRKYIVPIFRLINETYKDFYGFVPLDEKEMHEVANKYLPILDPAFVTIAVNNQNEIIAFIVAIPDMNEGIIRARGKLFPFGFIKILRSAKKTKRLIFLLGAIKDKYRNLGFDALLVSKIIESAKKRGIEMIDSHLILENNNKMRAEMEKLNGVVYKRYRIYQKPLV